MISCSDGLAVLATSSRRHKNDSTGLEVKMAPVRFGFIMLVDQQQRGDTGTAGVVDAHYETKWDSYSTMK